MQSLKSEQGQTLRQTIRNNPVPSPSGGLVCSGLGSLKLVGWKRARAGGGGESIEPRRNHSRGRRFRWGAVSWKASAKNLRFRKPDALLNNRPLWSPSSQAPGGLKAGHAVSNDSGDRFSPMEPQRARLEEGPIALQGYRQWNPLKECLTTRRRSCQPLLG